MGYVAKLLGKNIELLRETSGLSSYDLAKKLNVSFASVCRWEAGKMWISEDTLEKLSMVLNVPVEVFFKEHQTKTFKKILTSKQQSFEPSLRESIRVINENIEKITVKIKSKNEDE